MVKVLHGHVARVDAGLSTAGAHPQHQSGRPGRDPACVSGACSAGGQVDVSVTSRIASRVVRTNRLLLSGGQGDILTAHLAHPYLTIQYNTISFISNLEHNYSRTPLIRPPSESHWCGRIRGMVAREGFVYEQKSLSVTRNVVV